MTKLRPISPGLAVGTLDGSPRYATHGESDFPDLQRIVARDRPRRATADNGGVLRRAPRAGVRGLFLLARSHVLRHLHLVGVPPGARTAVGGSA